VKQNQDGQAGSQYEFAEVIGSTHGISFRWQFLASGIIPQRAAESGGYLVKRETEPVGTPVAGGNPPRHCAAMDRGSEF
jgi:hypothetical protein